MIDFSLNGKVALVTGASRGIGESIALNLSQYGAKVILVSRKEDALKEVAEKVKAAGGEALVMACHTGNLDQVEALVKRIEAEVGRLDILVNNAATNPHFGEMLTAPESATALQTAVVPAAKGAISKQPMGPFQTMVLA